jgi:hypothetical protein
MIRVTKRLLGVLALAGGFAAAPAAAAGPDHSTAHPPATGPLAQLVALAGEWVAAEDNPMVKAGQLAARYEVTAGGSAVVETIFPGSPHEMVTVYHRDGEDLVLTHYCLGNQPRMRAKAPAPGARRFEFTFDGGSNIRPESDRHMHSAWLELLSADELRSQWTELDGGKPAFVASMHLRRKTS